MELDGSGDTLSFDVALSGDFFEDESYIGGDITGDLTIAGSSAALDEGAFVVSDGS